MTITADVVSYVFANVVWEHLVNQTILLLISNIKCVVISLKANVKGLVDFVLLFLL